MRYGIRSINMDEIASSLGISKKTIYQFFKDKEELIFAVIERETAENEKECVQFQTQASDAVQEIFLAVENLEELLRSMHPQAVSDLEKYHPRAYQKIREFKYQFLLEAMVGNLRRGIEEGVYRSDLQKDIVARSRIEASFLVFNADVFPHSRYSMADVSFELAILFLHGVATDKGRKLIEKYTKERNKKLSHEPKV